MEIPKPPSIDRRSNFVSPKVEIVVACEGKVTEKNYLEDCISAYGSQLVRLRWLPTSGIPMTVVNAAIEERQGLLEKARKSKDRLDRVFRVWAIFDRDAHPDVPEALQLARSNGVDVAFSDPCFELWPLLHLTDYGGTHGRHKVQSFLNQHMPNYHHDKNPIVDFEMIREKFDNAFKRAQLLEKSREAEGNVDGCPSTTMGTLVRKIIDNGKTAFSIKRSRRR